MEKTKLFGILNLLVEPQTPIPLLVNVYEPYRHTTPCSGEVYELGATLKARVLITHFITPKEEWVTYNDSIAFEGFIIPQNPEEPMYKIIGLLNKCECCLSLLSEKEAIVVNPII